MNRARRSLIRSSIDALAREDAPTALESIVIALDEEQAYFDGMPESLQGSARGLDAEQAIEHLEHAVEELTRVVAGASLADIRDEVLNSLECAIS